MTRYSKMVWTFLLLVSMKPSLYADSEATFVGYVKRFLDPGKRQYVLIDAGSDSGLQPDLTLETSRESPPLYRGVIPRVVTGALKVTSLDHSSSIARVTSSSTVLSQAILGSYPGMMVGDAVHRENITIERSVTTSPVYRFYYYELFSSPYADPQSFELREEAYALLMNVGAQLKAANSGSLMIKSFTDGQGTREANRVESYQRALVVRQFIIDQLGFQEEQVIALGLGEDDLIDRSSLPGSDKYNRRIEMSLIPYRPKLLELARP